MLVKDKNINYLFWDIGVTDNHNTNWEYVANRVTRTFTADGSASVLTMATGQTWGYAWVNSTNYRFNLPLVIEYNLVEIVDSPRIRFLCDTSSYAYILSNYGTGHHKWIITDSTISLTVNGQSKNVQLAYTRDNGLGIYWEFDSDTDGLTYKNFIVYYL